MLITIKKAKSGRLNKPVLSKPQSAGKISVASGAWEAFLPDWPWRCKIMFIPILADAAKQVDNCGGD
ncbi:hypothetical protein [Akkermansia sp.]|uniref:hypothetical protein n=1 Tax=Akkermansia sp. TaxID=1872421 RepID=UPI0025C29B4C|nr:hypothetical protein [Akkermansia sp.]MCC8148054.1 hypothetical protein [Akkermansia sp.]